MNEIIAFMAGAGVLALIIVAWIPRLQSRHIADHAQRLSLENDLRQALTQILGGALLLSGAFLSWDEMNRNEKLAKETQTTELLMRALDQLGTESIESKVGAIYALGRIMEDSDRDFWPITQVLTA